MVFGFVLLALCVSQKTCDRLGRPDVLQYKVSVFRSMHSSFLVFCTTRWERRIIRWTMLSDGIRHTWMGASPKSLGSTHEDTCVSDPGRAVARQEVEWIMWVTPAVLASAPRRSDDGESGVTTRGRFGRPPQCSFQRLPSVALFRAKATFTITTPVRRRAPSSHDMSMDSFDSLKREATKLERNLEDKVARYQQVGVVQLCGASVAG